MSLGPLVAYFAACSLFRSDKDRFLLSNQPAFYPPCIQGHTPFLLSFAFAYFDQWTRFLTKRLVNCITGECNWKWKESLFSPRYGTQKTCSSSSADSVCCSKMDWGRGDGSQYFQAAPRKEKKRRYVKLTAMGYLVLYLSLPPSPRQGAVLNEPCCMKRHLFFIFCSCLLFVVLGANQTQSFECDRTE